MDLGADAWQTFRFVTFPHSSGRRCSQGGYSPSRSRSMRSLVTIFTSGAQQTLPIWIFTELLTTS